MKITPVVEIGIHRALCVRTVRVAAGLATREARRRLWRQELAGLPIDQCGKRADFFVDGRAMCRAHAGAEALAHILGEA